MQFVMFCAGSGFLCVTNNSSRVHFFKNDIQEKRERAPHSYNDMIIEKGKRVQDVAAC